VCLAKKKPPLPQDLDKTSKQLLYRIGNLLSSLNIDLSDTEKSIRDEAVCECAQLVYKTSGKIGPIPSSFEAQAHYVANQNTDRDTRMVCLTLLHETIQKIPSVEDPAKHCGVYHFPNNLLDFC